MDGVGNSENSKQDSSIPIRNQFHKEVEKIASSFYITNFPDYVDAKRLWVECQSYRRIVDAFIANKRSKAGKRVKDLNSIPNLRTLLTKEGFPNVKLTFLESEYISDDESLHGAKNMSVGSQHGEDDLVDDSDVECVSETFFGDKHPSANNSVCNSSENVVKQQSEDPFYIYDMLNKKRKCVAQDSDLSLSHPPGFTPEVSRQENDHRGVDLNTETDKVNSPLVHTKVMNNSQKVHENVTSNGESAFNYSHNAHNGGLILEVDSAGSSGGILYIWEATIFNKDYATVSDNFIAIYGNWIFNNSKVLIVVIYAPRYLSHKRVLWDYISSLITHWNVETIVMGDFNEGRSINERFGSMFNHSSSRLFNHFITSSGLVDVKLEGYSFTWAHPSATKMSKLDRFLVSDDTNGLIWFKKKLQDLKKIIRSWIKDKKLQQFGAINSIKEDLIDIDKNLDIRNVCDETLLKRMELTRQLHDINQMEAMDYVQKSKIKWAIEGDENSKFFHGIINKKRSQLSIRGVYVDGDWNTDPEDKNCVAVWNCGENKSPGPDGSSPKGSNSSFIALILKVTDAKFVIDFRPISLIGCVYKVVTKILANRLATDACAREDQLDSSRRRYKNLVCHTHKLIQAYHHLSNVAFKVRVREMNRLKSSSDSLIRSRHRVFMKNQRLSAEVVGLRGKGTSRAIYRYSSCVEPLPLFGWK
nr:RNA-directed DNA polymerase, eukaryota [Tanacetum cinerariifolium]